jgi:hypothetical protein
MPSILCAHSIPVHYSSTDAQTFQQWHAPFAKIVSVDSRPAHLDDFPADTKLIIRNHPMSEGYGNRSFIDVADAQAQAVRDVNECRVMTGYIQDQYGIASSRLLFEGRNEPMVWSTEPPPLTAAYYAKFLTELHKYGLRGVALNLGVGWPGNDGTPEAPPLWKPFEPVINAMLPGDYIGLHEYWAGNGPEEAWKWWGGRFSQCPYDVPMLITECGVDFGVVGLGGNGWLSQHMPGNTPTEKAIKYVSDLRRYEELVRTDGRVVAAFIFTHDGQAQDWWTFDTRHPEFVSRLLNYTATMTHVPLPPGTAIDIPPVEPPVEPPPVEPPPTNEYIILGEIIKIAPNDGVTYVYGKCHNELGEGVNGKLVRVSYVGSDAYVETKSGPHTGYENWPAGYYSIPLFVDGKTPCKGNWQITVYDPVRKIYAPTLTFITDGAMGARNQYEIDFAWTLAAQPPVEPPVEAVDDAIRNKAWNSLYPGSIAYNPAAAFGIKARELGLGVPTTSEVDYEGYRLQGFAKSILYCKIGNWGNIKQLTW